jgi:hypothetical protein
MLEFSPAKGNSKLRALKARGIKLETFSMPAGWTCPGAAACKVKVSREGALTRGQLTSFDCFSAMQENMYPSVRAQRWRNWDALLPIKLDVDAMAELIAESLPKKANTVRIHVSGDFFNAQYFLAWCKVARENPSILFYAYTKSLRIWVANRESVPDNLVLTASYGGLDDALIEAHNLRSAKVVFSVEAAGNLPIDHDDSHAMAQDGKSFALLIHGVQKAGSDAAKALRALNGLGSYSSNDVVNERRAMAVDSRN